MKRLRVYLSSTFEDLKEYRAAVSAALEKAGLDVARMEGYTAADERPLDLCLRDVAQSELYVGLCAWRYGYVPPAEHGNPQGKSITELEYRLAESTASVDETLRVWEIAAARIVATFRGEGGINACAVTPDGRTFLAGDRSGGVHFLHLELP